MTRTTKEIKAELFQTIPHTTKEFIGFIVCVDKQGNANHSGLIIAFGGKTFLFHYLPRGIFLEEIDLSNVSVIYYFKRISIIDNSLIRAFLIHCKVIRSTAKPNYGFFYAGSYYENGRYHSEDNTPQLMTCVGFCINVITGFLEEKTYIEFNDWVSISQAAQDWLNKFLIDFKKEFPAVDENILRKNLKRIKPSELISSAYFSDLPVRKAQTDEIKLTVEEVFKESA